MSDTATQPCDPPGAVPCILLAGAGVVGRAILAQHLQSGFRVVLLDSVEAALRRAVDEARRRFSGLQAQPVASPLPGLAAVRIAEDVAGDWKAEMLIESIPENLELKQSFFASAARSLGASCVLASNTSNLRVADVFGQVVEQSRCLGIHFFMPVDQRPLVELIRCQSTAPATLQRCSDHARRLGKEALVTGDSPGFVVNRMLAPYLNQSLLLLGRGASPELIAAAAHRFGMPMSPLELIDLIGIRTAFDSGRVFWRSFPRRIDPAPILSGMIKAGRLGTSFGGGFFAEAPELPASTRRRSAPSAPIPFAAPQPRTLHGDAVAVIQRYQRDERSWTETEVLSLLSLPMWIEAAEILAAGVVDSFEAVELGLRGGLGFARSEGFFAFFDGQGTDALLAQLKGFAGQASLSAPVYLCDQLRLTSAPSEAIRRYVAHARETAAVATAEAKA